MGLLEYEVALLECLVYTRRFVGVPAVACFCEKGLLESLSYYKRFCDVFRYCLALYSFKEISLNYFKIVSSRIFLEGKS